ncbi:GntR family transcriptional regulator [Amycolatopsis sp. cg5]|uniref:GntR family transcriptional regulator n=1 Tax=Amycolatopsis sp. cg5 TaxID=3238802 RepID=UPI003523A899
MKRTRSDSARQLADVLRRQILADEPLPCEQDLCAEYAATRNTVREALDLLRADGLITRQPGIGTVVVGHKVPHGLNRLGGLAEILREHGEVTNEVRTAGPVPALGGLPTPSPALLAALADDHANVRRAAVQALTPFATTPEIAAHLSTLDTDSDADVRAYARLALG